MIGKTTLSSVKNEPPSRLSTGPKLGTATAVIRMTSTHNVRRTTRCQQNPMDRKKNSSSICYNNNIVI